MGVPRFIGKVAFGVGAGTIGLLAAIKLRDDRYVGQIWQELEQTKPRSDLFREEMVSGLPDPARRYFLHAIQPGTPLAATLHWRYFGSMKPGQDLPWMSLQAKQILAHGRGFVWKARAWKGPLLVTAADHYLDGVGRMQISFFGLIPIVNATGPDLSKSAMARMLIEGVALPSALLPGPNIGIEGIDDSRFTVTVNLHGETTPITLRVDPDGRLKEWSLPRWGNLTPDGSYEYIPYGGTADQERTFGSYTIPTRIRAGWWYGTEQYLEVVRLQVEDAQVT